jgi:RimJ/RimL family protein N-acetyltransferase
MTAIPTIRTSRLLLRPYRPDDAADLARLAGHPAIADTTISIPHPYTEAQASAWIATHAADERSGQAFHFAVTLGEGGALIGGIEIRTIEREYGQGELSFWIGVPWWGMGFATEAGAALLDCAFGALGLNRIYAHHMVRNPASGRVLEKLGFRREGLLRQRVRDRQRVFQDVVLLARLRGDSEAASAS